MLSHDNMKRYFVWTDNGHMGNKMASNIFVSSPQITVIFLMPILIIIYHGDSRKVTHEKS
jgi:hypothetical protein